MRYEEERNTTTITRNAEGNTEFFPFIELPQSVALHVMERLSVADLCSAMLCSKQMRDLIHDEAFWMRKAEARFPADTLDMGPYQHCARVPMSTSLVMTPTLTSCRRGYFSTTTGSMPTRRGT